MVAINHNLSQREQRMLAEYRRRRLSGGLGRGWQARLAQELGWSHNEVVRAVEYLRAAGLIEGEAHCEPDPSPEVQREHELRRLAVEAAKARKLDAGLVMNRPGESTSVELAMDELDQVLPDLKGGSTAWERTYRATKRRPVAGGR